MSEELGIAVFEPIPGTHDFRDVAAFKDRETANIFLQAYQKISPDACIVDYVKAKHGRYTYIGFTQAEKKALEVKE
jgi:hypothetical protein